MSTAADSSSSSSPSSLSSVAMKTLPNGETNPQYVDLLDEDPPLAGQKFVCVSFLSPESILKQREIFFFERFIQNWDMSKSMEKCTEFVNFLAYKYNLNSEQVIRDFQDFVAEEEKKLKATASQVEDDFKNFLDKNEETLIAQFNKEHSFQTSVRGIKIRGSFSSQEEAETHCKKIRERDPSHDIFVAPVGLWLPWEPTYYKLEKVQYLEPELNKLHEEKIKNEARAKNEFDARIKEAKRKAIEENVRKAKASGNKLTQTLDAEGNLVGANTMNFDEREVANDQDRDEHAKRVYEKAIQEKA